MQGVSAKCCWFIRPVFIRLGAVLALSLTWGAAFALANAPEGEQRATPRANPPTLQIQELDDPVEPIQPVKPRTGSEDARLDALAWYGTGRMLQQRGDMLGALRAYRRAIESDPTAVAVYRVAIPLAVELRQLDDAARWAAKAVEFAPEDYNLLMQAAALLINREDLPGAIHVLEQAVKAPGLNKESPQYVIMMRDLAILYSASERNSEAAEGFAVVFDALVHPEKYHLTPQTRAQLQGHPAVSFERLGQVFLEQKKTDLALAAFQKAAESKKGPAAGNLSFNLAQVYLQAGQPEKALEELQKYIDSQRQSKGRAAYELLAEILQKLNKSDELISRLQAAAERDSRNSTLQFYLADQYAVAGRLDEAEALFKKTLESSSELAGYIGLAGVYRRQSKPTELIEALGKAYAEAGDLKGMSVEIKAVTSDEKLLESVLAAGEKLLSETPPRLDFASGYVLANLAGDAKRTPMAEKLYRHLLTLRKERAPLIFEELGGHYLEVRKYAEAAKVFQEAVNDPQSADARPNFLFQLTQALELSGDTKGALQAIATAQQIIPNNPLLRFQEGWVYYHSHQFDEAVERFEKILADFPQPQFRTLTRRVQYSLSNIHVLKGEIRKGEEILEAIYRENPNDISVNNDLGYLYADQGKNLEQAESMVRKALEAEPENAAYLDSMGWVLFKVGKFDEAIPYLEKAVKISTGTGDETLYDHLGDVYDRLGQRGKAIEAWKKSVELAKEAAYPDQKLIERVEEKLRNLNQDQGKLKPARSGAP